TKPVDDRRRGRAIRRFRAAVTAGPISGATWSKPAERCAIGSHPSNDPVIDDAAGSRFPFELTIAGGAVRVRDLGSRHGTLAHGMRIVDVTVDGGTTLVLGDSAVKIHVDLDETEVASSERPAFGNLVGDSALMREVFSQLERVAASDAT